MSEPQTIPQPTEKQEGTLWTWKAHDLKSHIQQVSMSRLLKEWCDYSPSLRNWIYCSLISAVQSDKWFILDIPMPDHIVEMLEIGDEREKKLYLHRSGKNIKILI